MKEGLSIRKLFEQKLLEAQFQPLSRQGDRYWKAPGERGIIYDTAEAVKRMLERRALATRNVVR